MNETRTPRPARLLALAAALGAFVGTGAIYMTSLRERNESSSVCSTAPETLAALKPLARGEVAGMLVPDAPRGLPPLRFIRGDGSPVALSDFSGRTVLLNLWATWCAPCREEMPALDQLQMELGGSDFEVAAVSIDTGGTDKARDFLRELKIGNLPFYAEPRGELFAQLKAAGRAVGLPTTLLIGPDGCEIGYLPGPADWASEDAKALVRTALGRT